MAGNFFSQSAAICRIPKAQASFRAFEFPNTGSRIGSFGSAPPWVANLCHFIFAGTPILAEFAGPAADFSFCRQFWASISEMDPISRLSAAFWAKWPVTFRASISEMAEFLSHRPVLEASKAQIRVTI